MVGGGIAGTSIAAELSSRCSVVLAEREPQLAHHTTGRSAAAYIESYGTSEIRLLTTASRSTFDEASAGDVPPVLTPRAQLWVATTGRDDHLRRLDRVCTAIGVLDRLDAPAVIAACDALDPDRVAGGAIEPTAQDIDVPALLQHYVRVARRNGAEIRTGAGVTAAARRGSTWRVATTAGTVEAPTVVDAAGAWCDGLAELMGASPLGFRPLRRTIGVARADHVEVDDRWPLVVGMDEDWYFKPEGPNVLVSPADETPSPPCDARPDEIDVAAAIERVNAVSRLGLRSVVSTWAGLRTFSPDRNPVVGHDPATPGLFWFAGQGGYGIQAGPALARLGAALVNGEPVPADLVDAGLDHAALAPERFGAGR